MELSTAARGYNACVDLLDRNVAAGRGQKPAFIDPERQLSYGELQRETCRFANLLTRLGVRREERILLAMTDTVDFPIAFLGAIRAGIVPVPVNTMLAAEQYAYIVEDCRAALIVASESLLPVLGQALAATDAPVLVAGGPAGRHLDFSARVAAEDDGFATAATHADETAFWLYSSGSTGMPKGTRHVHASLMLTAELFGQAILGIEAGDTVYSAAKFFFAYGLGNSLSFPMSVGATTVLTPARPTPAVVFDILARHAPTIFCGVPTLFAALLNDPDHAAHKGSPRLRICTSAGEGLPEHIGLAWKARFGADILDGTGSTEMLHIYLSNVPGAIRYGSSGVAVPGYDLRLLDESGAEVADGDIGELYVRGPTAADGYWNQREKSRATFQGPWTKTGDKYVRHDGRYTYCGRADDMFKVSGIWVSPFEVEAALATHESVLEAAVVPAADAEGLLKPKAYIVLKSGAPSSDLDAALKDHVKASCGLWKYPRWIEIVDALPKTATGKIQRFKLRDAH
jgi:4-hydroxybenzoate-CoA ligase